MKYALIYRFFAILIKNIDALYTKDWTITKHDKLHPKTTNNLTTNFCLKYLG